MNIVNFKNYLRLSKKRSQEAEEELKNYYEELQSKIEVIKGTKKNADIFDKILDKTEAKELQELERISIKVQKEVDSHRRVNYLISKIISSFDNYQAIKFIEEPSTLFAFLMMAFYQKQISMKDISEIFGSSMVFNATHLKKGKASEKLKGFMAKFSEYYNFDGTFKPNDNDQYLEILRSLLEYDMNYIFVAESVCDGFLIYEDVIAALELLQKEYQKNVVPVSMSNTIEAKVIKDKNRGEKLKELRKYYKNGDLVCIPDNLDTFSKLLEDLQVDEKEQRYIYGLINQALLDSKANKEIEPQEEYVSDNESNCYLIFLKDASGINYFDEDLDQMDKGYQDMCLKALDKVNKNFKRSFRRVMVEDTKEIRLYEVYNSVAHVIFYPLKEEVYLILGASIWRDNYNKIINRFFNPNSKTYIEEIRKMLCNPEEREKLLNESIYPPVVLSRK